MTTGALTILGLDDPRWSSFAAEHPEATPFHQPAWAAMLADCYRFTARAGVCMDGRGEIVAGMPVIEVGARHRRWASLPFTDRCAPLATRPSARSEFARQLEKARTDLGLRSIEVRDRLEGTGWSSDQGYSHEVELGPDPEQVYARFDSSRVKRKIRRAAREHLQVERGQSQKDLLEVFYRLHVETRRRLGVPVQPRSFFELLSERILARDLGFVLTARLEGTPVASAVFLAYNGRVTYKFSASDDRYGNVPGTHAVVWQAIQDSCAAGARVFDFGRTEIGNDGLRAFKLSWGADERPLAYTVLASSPPSSRLEVAQRLLKPVIRHSPTAFGRAIGALGYRYTA
jgi:CelD/BcsL family acetyltransferase involved in cellulose biosynthesis